MSSKPFPIATARGTREGFTLKQRGGRNAFTLAELLVSVFVLAIIILMMAQLMNSAAAVSKTGHKHISTDTQARTVFDQMAVDFAQMLKRNDVDYYVKGTTIYNQHGHGNGHGWGYYKLQRMGKGLQWNGVDTRINTQATYPIVFLDQTIGGTWPPAINNTSTCGGGSNTSCDPDYETVGPGVFRLEYYYLLKNGKLTDVPWDQEARPNQTSLTTPQRIGITDVESITVGIAVIDSAGRALIDAANLGSLDDLASDLADFRTSPGRGVGGQHNIGDLEASWQASLLNDISAGHTSNGYPLPPEAAKAIRVYSKTFDLRTL